MGIYDIVLKEKYGEDGLTREETDGLFDMLKTEKGYPVELMAHGTESSAMGFISPKAASALDFDYTGLREFIAGVLDKTEPSDRVDNDCSYKFNGLLIWLN